MLSLGAATVEIVMATFILNFRHFLMSASLSQRIDERTSKRFMSLLAFGITDETFSLASMWEEKKLSPYFLLGINTLLSVPGIQVHGQALLGTALPDTLQNSMGIAIYCMFIGLLLPSMKKSIPVLVVAAMSMVIHSMFKWIPVLAGLSSGFTIIIATIAAATLGTILFPEGSRISDKSIYTGNFYGFGDIYTSPAPHGIFEGHETTTTIEGISSVRTLCYLRSTHISWDSNIYRGHIFSPCWRNFGCYFVSC